MFCSFFGFKYKIKFDRRASLCQDGAAFKLSMSVFIATTFHMLYKNIFVLQKE